MKKIIFTVLTMSVILAGCNTVKGVGQDVSKVGSVVTDTAEKTSDGIKRN